MIDMFSKPFYLDDEAVAWVETTFARMTPDEKIAQLFMDMLWGDSPKQIGAMLQKHPVGGFRYHNRTPEKLHEQNQAVQRYSRIPALIAANVESGGNGAVAGGTKIGDGIACAATGDAENAYRMGLYGCREAAAVGCNWTFAPVVDIDRNWRNCVIPNRCFGSDSETVLEMALAYMRGAHEAGVACCMKHFPGDGCDERDQHLVTTINDCTCEEWDSTYGKVFRGMIDAGVPSLMVGHIQQPAWSRKLRPGIRDEAIMPATLAPELLTDLLRGQLGFNGLIITDATQMVGLTSRMRRSEYLPTAIQSGCDMILYLRDPDEDMHFMRQGLENGLLSAERLDDAVLRVLAFKAHLGLHTKQAEGTLVPCAEGLDVIGCQAHKKAAAQVIDASITLVKDTGNILPLTPERHHRVILFPLIPSSLLSRLRGGANRSQDMLAAELKRQGFSVEVYKVKPLKYLTARGLDGRKALAETTIGEFKSLYDAVILMADVSSFATTNERSLHWSIPMGQQTPWYVPELPTVFISLAHPFHLMDVPAMPAYINVYNNTPEAIRQVVEKITGKSKFRGVSPVDAFCGMWDTRL